MDYQLIAAFTLGLLVGWITKIPIFLRHYREWETERNNIRKYFDSLDKRP